MEEAPTVSITHVINSDNRITLLTISYEWWYFINIVLSSCNIVGLGIKKPQVMYLVFWAMRAEGKKRLRGETSTLGRNHAGIPEDYVDFHAHVFWWLLPSLNDRSSPPPPACPSVMSWWSLVVAGPRSTSIGSIDRRKTGLFLPISSHRSLKTGRTKDDDDDDDGRHG